MIAEPPFDAGGVNVTVACWLPGVAVPIVGAPGTVLGVTLFDGADDAPVPTPLMAATLNVYAVPLARPFTVIDVHGAVQVPAMPEGDEVAT